jgi:hypothetical protein
MLALLAFVGLAVDGGSMYAQRRTAQNAADGAALAGARLMLTYYEFMASGTNEDEDGTLTQERDVRNAILQYASANGVLTTTLTAFFVDNNKQLVTVSDGLGGCGDAENPCPVGKNGVIPWTRGATGVIITVRAQTGSIFFKVFGLDTIGATASATAYVGVAADSSSEFAISHIGFPMNYGTSGLQPGQTYPLMDGDSRYDVGDWATINYNNNMDGEVEDAWFDCGYNPSLGSVGAWNLWCGSGGHHDAHGYGPTQYWTGATDASNGPYTAPRLQWGAGMAGWWLSGYSLTASDNCDALDNALHELNDRDVLLPLYDMSADLGGGYAFHLLAPGLFHIENSYADCHISDPDPPGSEHAEWHVEGTFMQQPSAGSSGVHGDLRHNSLHVVFLEH